GRGEEGKKEEGRKEGKERGKKRRGRKGGRKGRRGKEEEKGKGEEMRPWQGPRGAMPIACAWTATTGSIMPGRSGRC
ncbi:hypothetical protein ACC827_38135, partial [Rhizobium ruizarguesonis]